MRENANEATRPQLPNPHCCPSFAPPEWSGNGIEGVASPPSFLSFLRRDRSRRNHKWNIGANRSDNGSGRGRSSKAPMRWYGANARIAWARERAAQAGLPRSIGVGRSFGLEVLAEAKGRCAALAISLDVASPLHCGASALHSDTNETNCERERESGRERGEACTHLKFAIQHYSAPASRLPSCCSPTPSAPPVLI